MKYSLLAAVLTSCCVLHGEEATLSAVTVTPYEAERHFEISYRLSNAPAIVTLEVLTNGVNVGGLAGSTAKGDVNALIQPDSEKAKRIVWFPDETFPNTVFSAGAVSVRLTLWSPTTPPDYMAVRIVPNSARHVAYYVSEESLPGGIGHRRWRTEYLLMRRIPHSSSAWRMGAPAGEYNDRAASEVPHLVTLSKDYYIGVFPVTQGQFVPLWGTNPSPAEQQAVPNAELLPVTNVKIYGLLRNTPTDTAFRWPEDGHKYADVVFMGKLKSCTGIAFDLPTDAQWEYACRAGERAALPNGKPAGDASVSEIAWYNSSLPAPVGSLKANNWGLYDMIGNVAEWCLDWWSDSTQGYPTNDVNYQVETEQCVDPVGPKSAGSSDYRVIRGLGAIVVMSFESRYSESRYLRSAYRLENRKGSEQFEWLGFRVVCPCPAAATFD